jgi:hypothetical protein
MYCSWGFDRPLFDIIITPKCILKIKYLFTNHIQPRIHTVPDTLRSLTSPTFTINIRHPRSPTSTQHGPPEYSVLATTVLDTTGPRWPPRTSMLATTGPRHWPPWVPDVGHHRSLKSATPGPRSRPPPGPRSRPPPVLEIGHPGSSTLATTSPRRCPLRVLDVGQHRSSISTTYGHSTRVGQSPTSQRMREVTGGTWGKKGEKTCDLDFNIYARLQAEPEIRSREK